MQAKQKRTDRTLGEYAITATKQLLSEKWKENVSRAEPQVHTYCLHGAVLVVMLLQVPVWTRKTTVSVNLKVYHILKHSNTGGDFTTLESYQGGNHPTFCLDDCQEISRHTAFILQSNLSGLLTAIQQYQKKKSTSVCIWSTQTSGSQPFWRNCLKSH